MVLTLLALKQKKGKRVNNMDLRREILDIFQAIGLLLVFMTIFFGMKYPQIVDALNTNAPIDKPKDLKQYKANLSLSFVTNCLPLIVFILLSSIVVLPLAKAIIGSNGLQIWSYESLQLAYILITLWILLLLVWVVILSGRMLYKIIDNN